MVGDGMKIIRIKHVRGCRQRDAKEPTCDCRREDVELKPGQHHCPTCLIPTVGALPGVRLCGPCYWGGPIRAIPID